DPWFALQESASIEHAAERRLAVLSTGDARARYVSDRSENQGLNDFLGAATQEPLLTGLQNNLYLTFITGCWRRQAQHGVTALLHPTGHLTDPKADVLRSEAYVRYREAFHFINELL